MSGNGTADPIERKVQLTGGSTYTISLPKEWATEHGIDTGTSLYLYADDDQLVATRDDGDDSDRSITIELDAHDVDALEALVATAYVAGYDEIELTSATEISAEQRHAVRTAVTNLVGVEIQQVTDGSLTIRSLLDGGEVSLEQTVVQMRVTALSMHEDAVRAVVEDDDELARRVVDQDDDVDRLFALVSRQFHSGLADVGEVARQGVGRRTAFAYYRAARQLERIADHAEKIADVARRQRTAPPEAFASEATDLAAQSRRIVRSALSAQLDDSSIQRLQTTLDRRSELVAEVREADRALYEDDSPQPQLLATVLDSIERTAEYGANVAEAALQTALRGER